MSSTALPKRHRALNKAGERRAAARDATSSRDASEEDNDEVSDVGSLLSVQLAPSSTIISQPRAGVPPPLAPSDSSAGPFAFTQPVGLGGSGGIPPATRRLLREKRLDELSGEGSQSEGLDSPTYDGDVESTSTVGGTPVHATHHAAHPNAHTLPRRSSSPTPIGDSFSKGDFPANSPYASQRLPTPKASRVNLADVPPAVPAQAPYVRPADVPVAKSQSLEEPKRKQTLPLSAKPSMSSMGPPKMYTRPKELSEEDIRSFVQRAIEGRGQEDGVDRWWRTNAPPDGKVVRVYADGVYDLFHFGHALQLRQAKLSFPQVQLLVGVNSDQLCAEHKSAPAMTHAERCEAVRHCRWADEVLPDAPWVVTQEWVDKHDIDYIAHDEIVYPSKDMEDVYAFAKEQGKFVPTRRTPAISTTDLLERIVRGYRDGFFDLKLEKNGHPELLAGDIDWEVASAGSRSRAASNRGKPRDVLELQQS